MERKIVDLDLDYELTSRENVSSEPYWWFSRMLIQMIFGTNYKDGMPNDIARIFRTIRRKMGDEDSLDTVDGNKLLIIAKSEFDKLFEEASKTKLPPAQALLLPVLLDHLALVKARSTEDDIKLMEEYEASKVVDIGTTMPRDGLEGSGDAPPDNPVLQ